MKKVYVMNCGANYCFCNDAATNNVTATVKVCLNPMELHLPRWNKSICSERGYHNVSVIDVANHNVTATVKVGTYPHGIALTQQERSICDELLQRHCLCNWHSKQQCYSYSGCRALSCGIKINSAGTKIYVAHDGSNIFSIIDTDTKHCNTKCEFRSRSFFYGEVILIFSSTIIIHG